MENQIECNQHDEEEISLIDLFAVILRYRKLIVIGTVMITFLAGLYLFVLPMVVPSSSKKVSTVTYSIDVNRLPLTVERQLPNPVGGANLISGLFMSNVNNMPFFASVYKDHMIFSANDTMPESEADFNLMVQKILKEKKVVMRVGPLGATIEIDVEVPDANIDKVGPFISDLVMRSNADLSRYMLPQLEELRKTTSETITIMEQQTSMMGNSTQDLQRVLSELDAYLASLQAFVWFDGAPFIVAVAQGRMTQLIIVAFAAFFITVFIAFILNAVNNIKTDPQARKVISDAWKAGK